jgi:hypothetical protein
MRKTLTGAALLSTAALTLGLVGPANAARYRQDDPRETSHGYDLRAVQLRNAEHKVVVITHHNNLRRDPSSGAGGAVYIDTDSGNKGPEYVFVGGYYEGTDYQLLHTDGFGRKTWGKPVTGRYRMTVDYQADTVRMVMSRKALGHPDAVRVAVRASGTRPDGTTKGLVDWLGKPRSFTPWVARG